MIHYLTHNQIDKQKWDHCIKHSPVFLPYAFSWYLDIVSLGWSALIKGDYEYIMPLTGSKKFGIHYLFPPLYCQQLGVIPAKNKEPFEIDEFIRLIPEKYKYISIFHNHTNLISDKDLFSSFKYSTNYELNMNDSYESIYKRYSDNIKRNIKKAGRNEIIIKNNKIPVKEWVNYKLEMLKEKKINVKMKYIMHLKDLINSDNPDKQNIFYTAYNSSGKILAGILFFIFSDKALIFSFTNKEGKESRAFYVLLDTFIQDYSGKIKILDFMGSNIPGIAYTNEGYGGVPVKYPVIEINRLPGWVNLIRRLNPT